VEKSKEADSLPAFIPWDGLPCTNWIIHGTDAQKRHRYISHKIHTTRTPVICINSLRKRTVVLVNQERMSHFGENEDQSAFTSNFPRMRVA
jgi:hypothetical protein